MSSSSSTEVGDWTSLAGVHDHFPGRLRVVTARPYAGTHGPLRSSTDDLQFPISAGQRPDPDPGDVTDQRRRTSRPVSLGQAIVLRLGL